MEIEFESDRGRERKQDDVTSSREMGQEKSGFFIGLRKI